MKLCTDAYLLLTTNGVQGRSVRGLLLVVVVPEQSRTLTRESSRNPRVLVRDTPDSDTNTSLNIHARANHASVSSSVSVQLLLVSRSVHADIKLSVSNIDVELGEAVKNRGELGARRSRCVLSGSALAGHVSLKTNTVNAKTVGLDELGDANSTLSLGTTVLKVVVVVVEFGSRVGSKSHAESNRNESFTNDAVENAVTVSSVLVESLVDDIPVRALALVTAHDSIDVVAHDRLQGLVVPVAVGNPAGKLAVPNEGVAAKLHAARSSGISMLVGGAPVELAAVGLDGFPLHGVLGGERAELALGVENGVLLGVTADGDGGTKVLLAGSLHGVVKASSLARLNIAGEVSLSIQVDLRVKYLRNGVGNSQTVEKGQGHGKDTETHLCNWKFEKQDLPAKKKSLFTRCEAALYIMTSMTPWQFP